MTSKPPNGFVRLPAWPSAIKWADENLGRLDDDDTAAAFADYD